ncbi:MAG: 2-hydroxychromene-2-carboxylate isomerase [Pararhizobium sp.]
MAVTTIDWYFDLVSPFSYLQMHAFDRLEGTTIVPKPVLLGAILKHWGQIGPAEIGPKRLHTYRMCQWTADRRGIPFRMPPRHPFNPVQALRLLIGVGCTPESAREAFAFIFADGRCPDGPEELAALGARIGATRPVEAIVSDQGVKDALRATTEEAIGRGIFGVPTLAAGNEIFWGDDATGLCAAYLSDPDLFARGGMARIAEVEVGVVRKR